VVYASDLELGETTKMTFDEVKRLAPARVVFDSLSEFGFSLKIRYVIADK
jgi:circadian clock protein KaiC